MSSSHFSLWGSNTSRYSKLRTIKVSDPVTELALSMDSHIIAVGGAKGLVSYQQTKESIKLISTPPFQEWNGAITCMDFLPIPSDSYFLAYGTLYGYLTVVACQNPQEGFKIQCSTRLKQGIMVLSMASRAKNHEICIAIGLASNRVLILNYTQADSSPTLLRDVELPVTAIPRALQFNRNNDLEVVGANDGLMHLVDGDTWEYDEDNTLRLTPMAGHASFDSTTRMLVVDNMINGFTVFKTRDAQHVCTLPILRSLETEVDAMGATFVERGKALATGTANGYVIIWDLKEERAREFLRHDWAGTMKFIKACETKEGETFIICAPDDACKITLWKAFAPPSGASTGSDPLATSDRLGYWLVAICTVIGSMSLLGLVVVAALACFRTEEIKSLAREIYNMYLHLQKREIGDAVDF